MNTLTSSPLAPLLRQLFTDADATDAPFMARLGELPPPQLAALMQGDYRDLYGRAREQYLAISPETGKLLYILARTSKARSIVEFGTSFGISTLHLAAAVRDNGGGRVIGSELEPAKAARARTNLVAAGLSDLVEIREGDALVSLAHDLPETIDLVLLDGAKALYPRILALLEPRLVRGALIVSDNADQSPDFIARIRSEQDYLSVPFAADVEVSMRL